MAKVVATRINNQLGKVEDKGTTLVFDISVTKANVHGRRLHSRQSTSALVPTTDQANELSRSIDENDFWVIPDLDIKHYIMIQAPHTFFVDWNDVNLQNNLTQQVKRLFFFAGTYQGRLTIRSDIDQTITISYA